ncbi:MAG: PP2C family protein-serine/threonine phosphatase [Acidobacteriota bacterium]
MPVTFVAASAAGGWAAMNEQNDDRWRGERSRFVVADASGPHYGGYYAPFGVDYAIELLYITQDLAGVVAAADAWLRMRDAAYRAAMPPGGDRLAAARHAADAVRPPAWEHLRGRSFAHFTASVAVADLDGARATIAQVGSCRIYRRRGDVLELIARDHCLAAPHEEVVVACLGAGKLRVSITELAVAPGDRLVLCTDGAWRCGDDLVRRLCDADDLAEVLAAAAAQRRDSATALVVAIG